MKKGLFYCLLLIIFSLKSFSQSGTITFHNTETDGTNSIGPYNENKDLRINGERNVFLVIDEQKKYNDATFDVCRDSPAISLFRVTRNGTVGIGEKSPKAKLHIENPASFNTEATAVGKDHILFSSPDPGNGKYFGSLAWRIGSRRRAAIVATREDKDTDHVGLAFFTNGVDGPVAMKEGMRLTKKGNLLIGKKTQRNSSYKLYHLNF